MGLILDPAFLIKTERRGQNARQILTAISRTAGNTDIAISVVLDRVGPRCGTCRHSAAKSEAAPVHPGTGMALPIHPVTVPAKFATCQRPAPRHPERHCPKRRLIDKHLPTYQHFESEPNLYADYKAKLRLVCR